MTDDLFSRYPALEKCGADIRRAADITVNCYRAGGKLLVAGNGGSAADAGHIVGELMKGFLLKRELSPSEKDGLRSVYPVPEELLENLQRPLPAIALTEHSALATAFSNDVNPEYVFAQQLYGYGRAGDVFIGITTSGNSKNVCAAAELAKAMRITVIALTGSPGGRVAEIADCAVRVPESETYRVQELHLPVYHYLCAVAEDALCGGGR